MADSISPARPSKLGDGTHALAAAAGRGLQHHRRLEFAHDAVDFGRILARRLAAGDDRHIGGFGFLLGGGLVAEPLDDLGRRPDEDQPGGFDGAGKGGVFGQEAETGMNGLRAGGFRRGNHRIDAQIALGRGGAADLDRLADLP